MKPRKETRVALFSLGTPFNRSIFRWVRGALYRQGIQRVAEFSYKEEPEEFIAWEPDAVVTHLHNERILDMVSSLGIPAINTSQIRENPGIPTVTPDNRQIGRQAAQHLMEAGYQNVAFSGHPKLAYAKLRLEGFKQAIPSDGPIQMFTGPHPNYGSLQKTGQDPNFEAYRDWILSLPPKTGIFTDDDHAAVSLLETLKYMNIPPGKEIGVISGHDLQVSAFSELTTTPVSFERWGDETAKLLLRMLTQNTCVAEDVYFAPGRVRQGNSTRFIASDDPIVQEAVQFIQDHAHLDLTVEHVADAVKTPKRTLQRKMKQEVSSSISQLIRKAHVELAKQLLSDQQGNLHEIARKSGLSNQHRLIRVFKEQEGITPGEYRERHRD